MHHQDAAFLEFCEVTRSLDERSGGQQVLTLKHALLRALERAADLADRSRALEGELERVRTDTLERTREHQAFSVELHRQLTDAARDLATTKADGQEQLCALRLEVLAMEDQCQTLDEICRSLLLTIEQAAGGSRRRDPSSGSRISPS